MFWRKKSDPSPNVIHSADYEDLVKRISSGAGKIAALEITLEAIKTDIANLRGKFSARLRGLKEDEQKEEKKESETINNGEFVGFG